MATQNKEPHFLLFPLMAHGHMLPVVDIAILFGQQGVVSTIITTPLNARRYESTIARVLQSGIRINVIELPFPTQESGLPEGVESFDTLPSLGLAPKLFDATNLFLEPVEKLVFDMKPRPVCIISDNCLPYTAQISEKFGIPRFFFNGYSCLANYFNTNFALGNIVRTADAAGDGSTDSEVFFVPDAPQRIELTKNQLPMNFLSGFDKFCALIGVADGMSYGTVINTFEELEPAFVEAYRKLKGDDFKVWCVGPASLANKDSTEMVQRGGKDSADVSNWFNWLDSQKPGSVLYVAMGSVSNLSAGQLIELGLGLEASNRPFIWTIRGSDHTKELRKWIEENGFQERVTGRGIVIQGWAPQVAILAHKAVGGFLTHCGWNSTLEGISAGVPMITWPLFADQFLNEKLAVQVTNVAVRVGSEITVPWGEEDKVGVLIKSEDVKNAIDKLFSEDEEADQRRKRAKELSLKAKAAVLEGGSSYLNMKFMIEDLMKLACAEESA